MVTAVLPIRATETWRAELCDAVLRAEERYNSGRDAALRVLRQHRPDQATLLIEEGPARTTFLTFLDEELGGYSDLLGGTTQTYVDGRAYPYFGWYGITYGGTALEILLIPSDNLHGEVVCIARDPLTLRQFGDLIEARAIRPTGGRSLRYSHRWHNAPELDAEIDQVGWDDLVLAPETLTGVREAVDGFFRHRATYASFGFPWRRGILLVGPPGTGKTMIGKAIAASKPELPFLYVRDLSAENGREAVREIFRRARRLAPCILAFEDIDGFIFEGNRTIFLNELDGFQNNDGILVIASSNHPGKIDEALLKRPSRFDRVFHIGLPELAERRAFCQQILNRPELAAHRAATTDFAALADEVAEQTAGFTLAFLKEAFTSAALSRAQQGEIALDEAFVAATLAQVAILREQIQQVSEPDELVEWEDTGKPRYGFHPVRPLA